MVCHAQPRFVRCSVGRPDPMGVRHMGFSQGHAGIDFDTFEMAGIAEVHPRFSAAKSCSLKPASSSVVITRTVGALTGGP